MTERPDQIVQKWQEIKDMKGKERTFIKMLEEMSSKIKGKKAPEKKKKKK